MIISFHFLLCFIHQLYVTFFVLTLSQLQMSIKISQMSDTQKQTPNVKRTRFSEHPQVFEYSSGKKKDQGDNDSLLLDEDDRNEESEPHFYRKIDPLQKRFEDNLLNTESKFEEITSGFDVIEAFFRENQAPIKTVITPDHIQNYDEIVQSRKSQQKQRFSFRPNPKIKSGRETMSIEQEEKIKKRDYVETEEMSQNKKRMLEIENKNEEMNQEVDVQKKIEEQIKKKSRITMDMKDLFAVIDSYEKEERERKSQSRPNRITMDIFAIKKMLEEGNSHQSIQENLEEEEVTTPVKRNDMAKVFSSFKKNPTEKEINETVEYYLSNISKSIDDVREANERLQKIANELKKDNTKKQIKIKQKQRVVEQNKVESKELNDKYEHLEKKLKKIDSHKNKDFIVQLELGLRIEIFKYENDGNGNFNGRFFANGFYYKIKSLGADESFEIKLMSSLESKGLEKYVFNDDSYINIVKKFCKERVPLNPNLLEIALKVKSVLQNIRKLDLTFKHLSMNFTLFDFEIKSNFSTIMFKIKIGEKGSFIAEINLLDYFQNSECPTSMTLYDTLKPGYIDLSKITGKNRIFSAMNQMIEEYLPM